MASVDQLIKVSEDASAWILTEGFWLQVLQDLGVGLKIKNNQEDHPEEILEALTFISTTGERGDCPFFNKKTAASFWCPLKCQKWRCLLRFPSKMYSSALLNISINDGIQEIKTYTTLNSQRDTAWTVRETFPIKGSSGCRIICIKKF